VVEAEKLEWTKNIEEKKKNLKPGEQFEAQFDWKGILLPTTATCCCPATSPIDRGIPYKSFE
jgi:hypothetical protein